LPFAADASVLERGTKNFGGGSRCRWSQYSSRCSWWAATSGSSPRHGITTNR